MKRGNEASFQTGSSSSWVTQQDKWDQHWLWAGTTQCWASAGGAGETYVSIKIADVIQVFLYSYWYLVANVILVQHYKS